MEQVSNKVICGVTCPAACACVEEVACLLGWEFIKCDGGLVRKKKMMSMVAAVGVMSEVAAKMVMSVFAAVGVMSKVAAEGMVR